MADNNYITMDQLNAFVQQQKEKERGPKIEKGKSMVPTVDWIASNFAIFNEKYFHNQLKAPAFSVNKCPPDCWGAYDAATNTLSLTQQYERPEKSVKETLLHEMIHMYIITVKGINPMFEHGPMWKALAAWINADGWNIQAINDMTDDDVLYKGQRIQDKSKEGQGEENIKTNAEPQAQKTLPELYSELQNLVQIVQDLKQSYGLNESKKLVISEEQEKILIKILKEENKKKQYPIDPNKVLILKKKLDAKFIPLDYEVQKGGDVQCLRIAGRLTPKTKQVIEQLYEEDLVDWAVDCCKNMFTDEDECEKFAKLVVNRWLNNKISVHGMLDVNHF